MARQKNPAKFRRYSRIHMGVINLPEVEPPSGYPCALCKHPMRIVMCDHDHATGEFRGWLCNACNTGLGHVEKSGWLNKAQKYLKDRA